jgi:hypothetical protein
MNWKIIVLIACTCVFSQGTVALNSILTPGDYNISMTAKQLRIIGYQKTFHKVLKEREDSVFSLYKIPENEKQKYLIDWLIPEQLAGTKNIKNLYPLSKTDTTWGIQKKERVNSVMYKLVVTGQISLQQAQYEVSNNWIKAYMKYYMKNNW